MYALELARKGFKEKNIIPDAAAASIISMSRVNNEKFPDINFIIIGTNGFNEEKFMHSSGHSMIIAASKPESTTELEHKQKTPKIVLSLMTDKFKESKPSAEEESDNRNENTKKKSTENGGWYFRNGFYNEQVRDHSFFTQDSELQKQLYRYKDVINFYNPREDGVEIKFVDVVVSEKCFLVQSYEKKMDGVKKKLQMLTKTLCHKRKRRQSDVQHPAEGAGRS